MFWCRHKKLSEVKNGYQYCLKCGKAFPVPCKHKWKRVGKFDCGTCFSKTPSSILFLYECEKCGGTRQERIMA